MGRRNPRDQVDEIGNLLRRFAATSEDMSRAFADRHGMHHTAARAIVELMDAADADRPLTSGQLGSTLGLTPASVTALVDRLVAVGHVRREPDPTDRRRILLIVEPAALQLGGTYFRPLAKSLEEMMGRYSSGELEVVQRFLGDATQVLEVHIQQYR